MVSQYLLKKKIQDGRYKNIFIRDEGKVLSGKNTKSSTIFAKYGYIGSDERSLVLYEGNIQKLNEKNNISIVEFEKLALRIEKIAERAQSS